MTVRRVMGIETEYGIVVPGNPVANPMVASGDVVTAYAASRGIRPARASWDYADEAPLRDARGFDMGRGTAHPSQLTDVEDPTLANVVLTNGARLYVDHAHPEYSSPEVTNPLDAVRWDRAGERVMLASVRALASTAALPDGTTFDGVSGLRNVLLSHKEDFVRTVSGKMLAYALGRGLEPFDSPAVRQIARDAAAKDYLWSAIIAGIVRSTPFSMSVAPAATTN